jgi:hypothetical protein
MSEHIVVETIYGKYNKYEIVKSAGGVFSSPTFAIYKDGSLFKAGYRSLADAVPGLPHSDVISR